MEQKCLKGKGDVKVKVKVKSQSQKSKSKVKGKIKEKKRNTKCMGGFRGWGHSVTQASGIAGSQ